MTGSNVVSSPAVSNGVIYVGALDGSLYAFGLPNGFSAPARPNPQSLHADLNLRPTSQ